MPLLALPGVFRPCGESLLLAAALGEQALPRGGRVLDLCTGSGVVAIAAARMGLRPTAVDVSRRAVWSARCNGRLLGTPVRALRGDLYVPVAGERFAAIAANPPYLPAEEDVLPTRGAARAWEGGRDGRLVLDRIIAGARAHLDPGGTLLLVHSALCGTERTLQALDRHGFDADVTARAHEPFGPLVTARRADYLARGLLDPGQREDELVVVRGRARTARVPARRLAPAPARDRPVPVS